MTVNSFAYSVALVPRVGRVGSLLTISIQYFNVYQNITCVNFLGAALHVLKFLPPCITSKWLPQSSFFNSGRYDVLSLGLNIVFSGI